MECKKINKKKMKNFKVTSKTILVGIAVPVEVGQIKLDNIYQLSIYKGSNDNKMHYDIDDIDYQNVTYMGMEIDGYKGFNKLKEFHKELGIDLSDLIMKAASEKLDAQDLEKWISDNFKDSFKEL
jgi:hypothetical protein